MARITVGSSDQGNEQPGDPCPGFVSDVGRCWRMIDDRNLQAGHCDEAPSWTGRWLSPKGDRWWRV
jgi:hypothetical protein